MKRRVTLSFDADLLDRIDRVPGRSRSEKAEGLIEEALAIRGQEEWARELAAFYTPERLVFEEREGKEWQECTEEAWRDD